jgi:hypothetical protein
VLLVSNRQSETPNGARGPPDYGRQTKDQGPRTTDYGLRARDQGPRTKDRGLRTTDYGLFKVESRNLNPNAEIDKPRITLNTRKTRLDNPNSRSGFGAGPGLLGASPFGVFRVFRGFHFGDRVEPCGHGARCFDSTPTTRQSVSRTASSLSGGNAPKRRCTLAWSTPAMPRTLMTEASRSQTGLGKGTSLRRRSRAEFVPSIRDHTGHLPSA